MPWDAESALDHKADLSPREAKIWASIANRLLKQGASEREAIQQASGRINSLRSKRKKKKSPAPRGPAAFM